MHILYPYVMYSCFCTHVYLSVRYHRNPISRGWISTGRAWTARHGPETHQNTNTRAGDAPSCNAARLTPSSFPSSTEPTPAIYCRRDKSFPAASGRGETAVVCFRSSLVFLTLGNFPCSPSAGSAFALMASNRSRSAENTPVQYACGIAYTSIAETGVGVREKTISGTQPTNDIENSGSGPQERGKSVQSVVVPSLLRNSNEPPWGPPLSRIGAPSRGVDFSAHDRTPHPAKTRSHELPEGYILKHRGAPLGQPHAITDCLKSEDECRIPKGCDPHPARQCPRAPEGW